MKCVLFQFGKKQYIQFQWFIQPYVCHFSYLFYQFLDFGLSALSAALSERQRGTQMHSSYKHTKEAGRSLHSTVPGFTWIWPCAAGFCLDQKERALLWELIIPQDHEDNAKRILWGELQGSFHFHMDSFKINLLWASLSKGNSDVLPSQHCGECSQLRNVSAASFVERINLRLLSRKVQHTIRWLLVFYTSSFS